MSQSIRSINYSYIVLRFNVLQSSAVQHKNLDQSHIEAMDSISSREGNSLGKSTIQ